MTNKNFAVSHSVFCASYQHEELTAHSLNLSWIGKKKGNKESEDGKEGMEDLLYPSGCYTDGTLTNKANISYLLTNIYE